MKGIKYGYLSCLLLASAITIASCNDDDNEWIQEKAGDMLKIETCISDTRAVVTGTTFQKGDQIGLFVKTIEGHEYTSTSSNVGATYNGTQWNISQDIALRKNEYANVYAYYPYNASTKTVGDSIDIDISPIEANGQPDYMYGSCDGISTAQPTAKINFQHALARVTLAITKSTTDVGAGKISKIRIENDTLYARDHTTIGIVTHKIGKGTHISTKGRMSLTTGQINLVTNQDAFIETPLDCKINEKEATNVDFLVMPCKVSNIQVSNRRGGGVCAVITIDGAEYKVSFGYLSWEAGKQYTYPITINRKTAITPTVTPGEKVYMGFNGDNGKPLYWSSYNLGAKSPEEYGGLYGWADPTGKKTSTNLNDYPSANPPTDISGTEYDIARQMWGDNWRIPSNSEMWSLLSNSTEEWTTLNGVQGVKYTSEKNGNTIFFPVAPIRKGNVVQYESATYYWLDKLNKDDHTLAGTFYIYKGSNLLDYPTAGEQRYMGLPIRPVTE